MSIAAEVRELRESFRVRVKQLEIASPDESELLALMDLVERLAEKVEAQQPSDTEIQRLMEKATAAAIARKRGG